MRWHWWAESVDIIVPRTCIETSATIEIKPLYGYIYLCCFGQNISCSWIFPLYNRSGQQSALLSHSTIDFTNLYTSLAFIYKMGLDGSLNRMCVRASQSPLLSYTAIQYYSACCGALSGIFFIMAFIVADFIPPPHPSWDAQTVSTCCM